MPGSRSSSLPGSVRSFWGRLRWSTMIQWLPCDFQSHRRPSGAFDATAVLMAQFLRRHRSPPESRLRLPSKVEPVKVDAVSCELIDRLLELIRLAEANDRPLTVRLLKMALLNELKASVET